MLLTLDIIVLIVGLVLLTFSADYFVEGAVAFAKILSISPLMVGVFILGFGTSAPEILISTLSAMDGLPGLAVGNVVGSNIANVGLVLGVAAIIYPVPVKLSVLRFETTLMIIVSIIAVGLTVWDGALNKVDGVGLLIMAVVVIFLMTRSAKNTPEDSEDDNEHREGDMSTLKALVYLVGGLVVLLVSAKLLVWAASNLATRMGVSDAMIGLTIVAIGTSLPELAAAISSSLKKHAELTLGNIIGSNLFNLLVVLPIPAFFSTYLIPERYLHLDFLVMLGLSLGIPFLLLFSPKKMQLGKVAGFCFLGVYIAYIMRLVMLA